MRHALWNAKKFDNRAGFSPELFLKFLFTLSLMSWPPVAQAQVSSFSESGGEISGAVLLDTDNQPMSQIIVSLRSKTEGISRSVLTDYDGKFEVKGLPSGTYEVGVEENGFEPTRIRAELKNGFAKLVLRLRPSKFAQTRRGDYTVSVTQLKVPDKARDEYRKGLERLAKNDSTGSLNHFAKAAEVYPEYYEAHYHLGVVEAKLGRKEEAMQEFRKAIELTGGKYAWADFGVGFLLCQDGKPGEAETIIRKGLELDEKSPEGHVVLGIALLGLNRPDEAEKSAREALVGRPDFAEAFLVLSDVYAKRKEYRAQVEELETYLKLEPNGPENQRVRQVREIALKSLAQGEPQQ